MNNEKYLPIGTVVMLKEGKKRVMITGFLTSPNNDKEKIYDYSGCLYPEGVLTSDQILVFNHEQIDKIHHLGLIDEEEKEIKEKLNNLLSTMTINKDNNKSLDNTLNQINNNLNNSRPEKIENMEF